MHTHRPKVIHENIRILSLVDFVAVQFNVGSTFACSIWPVNMARKAFTVVSSEFVDAVMITSSFIVGTLVHVCR